MAEAQSSAPAVRRLDARSASRGADWLARHVAIALGFSLPISVALDNVFLVLLLLAWLARARWRENYQLIRRNPAAWSALLLLAWLALGLAWGSGPLSEGLLYLKKYSDLLLVPILVTVFVDEQERRRGLLALAAALALTLVLSYALALGWLPAGGLLTGDAGNPTVFKRHITQNILMAFAALLFAELALEPAPRRVRIFWAALSLGAAFNVLFLVQGRTGYVVLAVLVLWFLFRTLRWKGIVAAAGILAVAFAGAYQLSDSFHTRISLARAQADQWQHGVESHNAIGERFEFYTNTLAIIRDHPLLGVGTGGFVQAYEERVQGTEVKPTRNPHSQYLLTASQAGLVGLGLLVLLLVQLWRCAGRLPRESDRTLARGLVLTMAVGSLFNSLLIDHTESLFFAWASGLLVAGYAPLERVPQSGI